MLDRNFQASLLSSLFLSKKFFSTKGNKTIMNVNHKTNHIRNREGKLKAKLRKGKPEKNY